MRVLVTGAFGNIGRHAARELAAAGHDVRALRFHRGAPDRDGRETARRFGPRVEIVDGDLTEPATLPAIVRGSDAIVHLAFVIPPECLERPVESRRTNVDGTANLIAAARTHAPAARFLFASTLDVYGDTTALAPPRRVGDPVRATDAYTEHKIECEALVRGSGLTWGILRFADVPRIELRRPVPIMFDVPLAQRIESIHPRDAGLATARAVAHDATWGRVWHIGGGPSCQLTYGEYLARFFAAMELGPPLPARAFTTTPFCTDWLDTEESQRVFQYQRATFDDIIREVAALLGWRRPFARLMRPLVRRWMLGLSPYYRLPADAARERARP